MILEVKEAGEHGHSMAAPGLSDATRGPFPKLSAAHAEQPTIDTDDAKVETTATGPCRRWCGSPPCSSSAIT